MYNPEDRVGVLQTHNKAGGTCGEIVPFSVLDEDVKEALRISQNWSLVFKEVMSEIELKIDELNNRAYTSPNWHGIADFRDGVLWVKSRLNRIK